MKNRCPFGFLSKKADTDFHTAWYFGGHFASVNLFVTGQARQQEESRMVELDAELRVLERDLARWHADMQRTPRYASRPLRRWEN